MELIPIKETAEENKDFRNNPSCNETLQMTIDYYKRIGFKPPWIGYYAKQHGELVGSAAFKGAPVDGRVEIAYGTMEPHRNKGVGTAICKQLVDLALQTDPSVTITARTLAQENFSTKILKKNNFVLNGTVEDPEDGEVWEWIFDRSSRSLIVPPDR